MLILISFLTIHSLLDVALKGQFELSKARDQKRMLFIVKFLTFHDLTNQNYRTFLNVYLFIYLFFCVNSISFLKVGRDHLELFVAL